MIRRLVKAIAKALPERRPIGHHEPAIGDDEYARVKICMQQGVVGESWVKHFERQLAEFCGVENAVCTSSGTAALHVALLAAGVKPNDEVLVPALTFVGTANAISYCGAVPNFVDGTIGINAYKLRRYLERTTCKNPDGRGRLNCKTGRVISTLIAVDLLGFPADMPKLNSVADEFGLTLIEDAAQALGATLGNQRCGSFGIASIFSFNNNKIVTGNGGGALLTNEPWLAAKAWQLASTARVAHPYLVEHDAVGFNYRMPNLNAALASAQFDRIGSFLKAKQRIFERYAQTLGTMVDMIAPKERWHGEPNYWLSSFLLKPENAGERDELLDKLNKAGIQARALFTPLHQLPMYAECPRDNLDYACNTAARAICLPSGVALA